jgi:hypothetical protein
MSYVEYLAAEAVSDVRHEFLNGEVWESRAARQSTRRSRPR